MSGGEASKPSNEPTPRTSKSLSRPTSAAGEPIVSHGRGGQGNIGADATEYVDAEIHREGDPESTGGAYSAGRGGAGNIGSPKQQPVSRGNNDDVVPEPAIVETHKDEPYHSGRGGEGNAHTPDKEGPKLMHEGLADKLKKKLFKPRKEKSPA